MNPCARPSDRHCGYAPLIVVPVTEPATWSGTETVVVAGADHGMDIPGDPVASVHALGRYVDTLVRFLPAPESADRA